MRNKIAGLIIISLIAFSLSIIAITFEDDDITEVSADTISSGTYLDGTWELDSDGTLKIKTSSAIPMQYANPYPWMSYKDSVKKVVIEGFTSVSQSAFSEMGNLITVEAQEVTYFDYRAFYNCTKLETVLMPHLTKVGQDGFYKCSNLIQVGASTAVGATLPYVYYLPYNAFAECTSLPSISIGKDSSEYTYLYGSSLASSGITTFTTTGKLKFYNGSTDTSWNFARCKSLTTINANGIYGNIPDYSFYDCNLLNLNNIYFYGTETIGQSAFNTCNSIENITILYTNDTLKIGHDSFNSSGLKELSCVGTTIVFQNNGVVSAGSFANCSRLAKINSNGFEGNIGDRTFSKCSYEIPAGSLNNVKEIGTSAFNGATIQGDLNLPNVVLIGNDAFSNSKITNVSFGGSNPTNTKITIGTGAFWSSEVKTITFKDDVYLSTVGSTNDFVGSSSIFRNCLKLEKITFTDQHKFYGDIGSYCFYGCSNLKTIECVMKNEDDSIVTDLGTNVFSEVKSIGICAFENCDDLTLNITFNNVVKIERYAFATAGIRVVSFPELNTVSICSFSRSNITEISFFKKITVIDNEDHNYAYYGLFLNSSKLTKVNMPSIVVFDQIYDRMFYGCLSLTKIGDENGIIYGIDTIGNLSFRSCTSLESLYFHKPKPEENEINPITSIGNEAFRGCSRLTNLNSNNGIVVSITEIPEHAFNGCTNITSFKSSKNINTIGKDAFYNDKNLRTVTDNGASTGISLSMVSTIGDEAFYYCQSITKMNIGPMVTSLGNNTFDSCVSIDSIILPYGLQSIGSKCFRYCNSAIDITIPATLDTLGAEAFTITNSIAGNIYICDSTKNYGSAISLNGTWNVYSSLDNGSIPCGIYVKNGTFIHKSSFSVTFNGNFGSYNKTTQHLIDGAKIILPYQTVSSSTFTKTFGVSDSSSSPGLLIGSSGNIVSIYSGPVQSPDYTIFTDGKQFKDKITLTFTLPKNFQGGDVLFEVDTDTQKNSYNYIDVKYGSSIKVPQAILEGYDFESYKGSETGFVYKPGDKFTLSFYESSFIVSSKDRLCKLTLVMNDRTEIIDIQSNTKILETIEKKGIDASAKGYKPPTWSFSMNGSTMIGENDLMLPFDSTIYARYVPMQYEIIIGSNEGLFSKTIDIFGPYSLRIDEKGIIYATDKADYSDTKIFDPNSQRPGQHYGYYRVTSTSLQGIELDNASNFKSAENRTDGLQLSVVLGNSHYQLHIDYDGVLDEDLNKITGLTVTKDSSGENIIYSDLSGNGVRVSVPSLEGYVFSKAEINNTALPIENDTITVTSDYYGNDYEITLVLFFDKGRYAVKFETNNHEGVNTQRPGTISPGNGDIITFEVPIKLGYSFTGWKCGGYTFDTDAMQNSLNKLEITSDIIQQIGTITDMTLKFEAQWEANTYGIVLNLASGTIDGSSNTPSWKMGDTLSGLPEPKRTGYLFKDWILAVSTGDDDPIIITNGMTLTKDILEKTNGTINLQATWQVRAYELIFNENGAGGGTPIYMDPKEYEAEFELPSHNTYSMKNYTYSGWLVSGYRSYNDGDKIRIDEGLAAIGDRNDGVIEFLMNWTSTKYNVRYDYNNGNGPVIPTQKDLIIGDSFTPQTPDGITRNGYSFSGWSLSANDVNPYEFTGEFDAVMAGSGEADPYKTVTLYAVWAQLKYVIEYNLDSGVSGNLSPTNAYYGQSVTISNPSKVGYKFTGWTATGLTRGAYFIAGNGTVAWNDGNDPADSTEFYDLNFNQGGVVTLKATWAKATYRVQYDLNGAVGTLSGGNNSGSVGDSFSFPSFSGTAPEGYYFGGWSADKRSTLKETTFTSAMASKADENGVVTLYAVWAPNTYSIEFRYSDKDTYTSTKASYGSPVSLGAPERTGYKFLGWKSDDIASKDALYSTNATIWYSWPSKGDAANGGFVMNLSSKMDGVVHLTAAWEPINYRIVYSSNGGAGVPPTDSKIYSIGDKITLESIKDLEGTWGNKIILGWSTDPMASAPMTVDIFVEGLAEKANIANMVTFYAVWVEGSYNVIVDVGGATPSMVPSGWEKNDDGKYVRSAEYGSSVKEILTEWESVVLELPDHVFTSWQYNLGTVLSNVEVTAEFDEVSKDILYIFVGAIVAIAVVAFAYTRLERW